MIKTQKNQSININWIKKFPDSIALLDRNFLIIEASDQWCIKFHQNFDDISTKSIFELFPGFSEDWKTKLEYAMDGLKDIQIVDDVTLNDKTSKKLIWQLNAWKDGYGNTVGVVLKAKDVTETDKMKMELDKTKNLLDVKAEIAKIGSWEYRLPEEALVISSNVRKIFGIPENAEISLENAIEFYKEGPSRERMRTVIKEAMEHGSPWNLNLQLTAKNNQTFWANTIGRPKFKEGKCVRIIGTIQRISDQGMPFEAVPSSSENENQLFFKQSPLAMLITDYTSGKILNINDSFVAMTGYGEEHFIGKKHQDFQAFKDKPYKYGILRQLIEKKSYEIQELFFTAKNGRQLRMELKGRLFTGVDGKKSVLTTLQDLSHYKVQIEKSQENIKQIVNFSHMVAHDLKGHATNFSLLLNFLYKESEERKRKKLLSLLMLGNDHLTETIKSLRQMVAIGENNKVDKEPCDLNEYIFRAEQGLSGLIKKEKAKIVNEIPENLSVLAVPVYLTSILNNILSNALQFRNKTKIPLIILSAEVTKEYTVLSIEDNGIGIDLKTNQNKPFELCKKYSNSNNFSVNGLYFLKYQIELMNGKIEVESVVGEGSIFKVYFRNQ
jgi:PAS domain S-box-containing protein